MASVTNLDNDVNSKRGDRVTPAAVNEVKTFIEQSLGESLPDVGNDPRYGTYNISAALKDGVALCKLAALIDPMCVRGFKSKATMPFVQRENIALFLAACEKAPLNLPAHDRFLTVDLYDGKDTAQVLQALAAFSRAANRVDPAKFPSPIGAKSRGVVSPQGTGSYLGGNLNNGSRGSSNKVPPTLKATKTGDSSGGKWSPAKNGSVPTSPGSVSSWSKKSDEGATSPAWNIAQYGYMGGASQGNLGVAFGGRRQITTAAPHVPSLAEKEKKRREKAAEDEKLRIQAEEEERKRLEEEDEKARLEVERRLVEEKAKLRQKALEEQRAWEAQERRWKREEERRREDDLGAEARSQRLREMMGVKTAPRLQGQYLSKFQAEHGAGKTGHRVDSSEAERIRQLERELEKARERERLYQLERETKMKQGSRQVMEDHDLSIRMKEEDSSTRPESRSRPRVPSRQDSDEAWRQDEREYLRKQWSTGNAEQTPPKSPRPLPDPAKIKPQHTGGARPLPDPTTYKASSPVLNKTQTRTDQYLLTNPGPEQQTPRTTYANELGKFDGTAERDAEDRRRVASQTKTKAGGWASKSLLEREMELERQRQQEWEESQKETQAKVAKGDGVDGIGGGIGGKWDVNQWTGYTGGDGQNRGSQGIGAGRRQIAGPRPPPGGK